MRSVLMSYVISIRRNIYYVMELSFTQRGKKHLFCSTMVNNEKVGINLAYCIHCSQLVSMRENWKITLHPGREKCSSPRPHPPAEVKLHGARNIFHSFIEKGKRVNGENTKQILYYELYIMHFDTMLFTVCASNSESEKTKHSNWIPVLFKLSARKKTQIMW